MDFADDLPHFYDEFGTDALVTGHSDPVRGIFDAAHMDALGISGIRPVFRTAATSPIVRGSELTIKGIVFRTKTGERQGDAEMIWPLEAV